MDVGTLVWATPIVALIVGVIGVAMGKDKDD